MQGRGSSIPPGPGKDGAAARTLPPPRPARLTQAPPPPSSPPEGSRRGRWSIVPEAPAASASSTPRVASVPPESGVARPRALREEVVVELEAPIDRIVPLSAVRSTIILSSIASVRAAGYFDAYRANLRPDIASEVLDCVAGTWIPLATARAHYDACEALGLAPTMQFDIGLGTGRRAQGTLLGTTARLSTVAGATPWTLMAHVGRFWSRAFFGSGIRVVKTGPKDARIEIVRNALVQHVPYYRHSFRGFCTSLFELFCSKMWFREVRVHPDEPVALFRTQWA